MKTILSVGQRKLVITLLVAVWLLALLTAQVGPPDKILDCLQWAIGLYMAGNVGSKWATSGGSKKDG